MEWLALLISLLKIIDIIYCYLPCALKALLHLIFPMILQDGCISPNLL